MNKVFIVQETDKNIEPARRYGDINVMLTYADIKKGSEHVVKSLKRRLNNITSQDYILCVGDPMAIGIAVHIGLAYTGGQIQILKWDRVRMIYHEETITINQNML